MTPEVGEMKRENPMRRAAESMKVRYDSIFFFLVCSVKMFAVDPYAHISKFLG